MEISTSILSVKEEESAHTFYRLELAHTDYYHIDVMDGEFVENNTTERMKMYSDHLKYNQYSTRHTSNGKRRKKICRYILTKRTKMYNISFRSS